ncbi:MAG: PAS domain S-box protein [Ignavibacteria bacterium]
MSFGDSNNIHSDSFFDFISKFLKNKSVWQPERKRIWLALILLAGCLLLTLAAGLTVKSFVEKDAKKEFNFACSELQNKISVRLRTHAQLLRSWAAFFENSDEVTRSEWRNFSTGQMIDKNSPEIYGTGYAVIIAPDQLATHEKKIQSEGFPQYSVRPEGKREIYAPVMYVEPFSDHNLRTLGYDMFSEPVRRKAMETAGDYNTAYLSEKVTLIQEANEDIQADALMYVPVYKKGMSNKTVEERRCAIQGWVFIAYRMDVLMKEILENSEFVKVKHIRMEIFDDSSFSRNVLLYDSKKVMDVNITSSSSFSLKTHVSFNGNLWYLRFSQYDSFAPDSDYSSVWLIAAGGTGISVLLFVLYLLLINTNIKINKLAGELTRDLSRSEAKYRAIFKNDIYAICIFDLETFTFLDVNEAHCSMYGYSKEEFLSGVTIYDITEDPQACISFISQIRDQKDAFVPLRYHKKKDGTVFPVEIVGGSFVWKDRDVMFVIAQDITERIQTEEALQESEARHSSMIANISDVICIIDTNGIVKYNSPNIEKWFGWQMQDILGINGWSLIHPDNLEHLQEKFFTLLKKDNSATATECELRCKDGSYKPVHITGINLINDPVINGVLMNYHDITERKEIEAGLEKTREELVAIKIIADEAGEFAESIINTVREPLIVLDQDLRVVKPSQAFYKFFKVSSEETIGKLIYDLGNQQWNIPELRELLETILPEKTTFDNYEVVHDFSAIGNHIMLLNARQIKSKIEGKEKIILLAIEDITERRQIEEALQLRESYLSAIIENQQGMIWLKDPEGRVLVVNSKFSDAFGFDNPEAIVGKTDSDLWSRELADKYIADDLCAMETRNTIIAEEQISDKEGRVKWFETFKSPVIDNQGIVIGTTGYSVDITRRKISELELLGLNEELQISKMHIEENLLQEHALVKELTETKEELEKINSEKDKLFSIIAHDLKSPFQGFMGLTESMAEDINSFSQDDLSEIGHEMHITSKNLFALLNNLLEWARMQQGAISFNPTEIVLSDIVSENINLMIKRGEQKGIEIIHEADPDQTVFADEAMLNSVLRNLLSNAVKFTKKGGNVIVKAKKTENDMIEISVIDSGIGISEALSQKLFKTDEKTGRKGTDGEPSTGLGLLLCKEFVEKHGGRIWVKSEKGKGTAFYFTIPVA